MAQYKNLLIQAEMMELRTRLGEVPEGEGAGLVDQLDSAEREAMEQRLESSYRQIRDYQDTIARETQGQDTSLDTSEERYSHLCAKYQTAKSMISSLKQSSHLLEEELVDTQRRAGLPVRLPYDQELTRNLLSPPDELKRQPFLPPLPDMSREVSDSEDDVTAELDEAVPR